MNRALSDQAARAAIVQGGARLYQGGFVAGHDGNLSIRVDPDHIWSTPTGVSKGHMTETQLVKLRLDGQILEGHLPPSSEVKLHLRLYRELPDIGAVVHAHPPAATAFAAAGEAMTQAVLQEAVLQLGPVPVVPYALPGSAALADGIAPYCHHARALLLEYHGAVTWGKTMEQALQRMETLEHYARVLLHLRTLGCTRVMPDHLVAELLALRRRLEEA